MLKTALMTGFARFALVLCRRDLPVQPYFDSEFPHGIDQFISAAATNWATMALIAGAR